MNRTKVLLVEDERSQRVLYKSELEEEGYLVFAAKNGAEALEIAVEKNPDVAVLDIFLTGEDGLEVMGKLLRIDEKLPIILHTAYGAWQDNWRGQVADAYVIKSSDMSDLVHTIEQVLANNQLNS